MGDLRWFSLGYLLVWFYFGGFSSVWCCLSFVGVGYWICWVVFGLLFSGGWFVLAIWLHSRFLCLMLVFCCFLCFGGGTVWLLCRQAGVLIIAQVACFCCFGLSVVVLVVCIAYLVVLASGFVAVDCI